MGLNLTLLIAVNGVFPEGLFAGFELFFWGGLIRFLLRRDESLRVMMVWTVSLVLMVLTKHIGQFWFVYPVAISLIFFITGRFTKNKADLVTGFKLLALTLVSFATFMVIEQGVLWYLHTPNKTTIGRQGIYRIKELPWGTLSAKEKESLITHYTGWSKDPMLRTTYNFIATTHPWCETFDSVTMALAARHITDRNADDCLNDAFKAYMLHIEHNGFKSSVNDLDASLSMDNIATSIIDNNTMMLFGYQDFPENYRSRWACFFTDANKKQISYFYKSGIYNFLTSFSLDFLLKLCLVLALMCCVKIRWRAALLLSLPAVFAWAVMAFTCLITVFLIRYILESYMEAYMVVGLLLAILVTPRKLLPDFLKSR